MQIKKRTPNAHVKFQWSLVQAKRLALLTSNATENQFEQPIKLINNIADAREEDKIIETTDMGWIIENNLLITYGLLLNIIFFIFR